MDVSLNFFHEEKNLVPPFKKKKLWFVVGSCRGPAPQSNENYPFETIHCSY